MLYSAAKSLHYLSKRLLTLGMRVKKTWATFEDSVREYASAIWGKPCLPLHIGGVDLDGAMEVDSDIRVFVEMTERRELAKVREDVNKLLVARAALQQETGAYARCYCIVNGPVTNGMVEAGAPHSIKVLSFENFSKIFFDFESYKIRREKTAFGSAVNPLTGARDEGIYIPVKYIVDSTKAEIGIDKIAEMITAGKHVILLGEYGSGKSRCIRELFYHLSSKSAVNHAYPMAIDLREAWGVKRGLELVRRHLEDIGADDLQSAAVRALNTNSLLVLFDGFDEIGSQAWSNDGEKLRAIRSKSLEGAKDLIDRSHAGIFISGREHYFNNNAEMLEALGVAKSRTVILRCKTEFTEQETQDFFTRLQTEITVPSWLPRRPLICQTIADLSSDELDEMFGVGENEIEFWNHFVHVLCERDARIHVSFSAETIERILIHLSRLTRSKAANVGPITLADVQAAFEAVVGQSPVEDASAMLQRLPALGRVKAESNDRQFIDTYILDGLRAKDVSDVLKADESVKRSLVSNKFVNPLGELGQRILAKEISENIAEYLQFAGRCVNYGNAVLASDIVSSSLIAGVDRVDFKGMTLSDGSFIRFDLSKTLPVNLILENCVFGSIVLPSAPPPGTRISSSLAERVYGVSSENALPLWIVGLTADHFDSVESVSRIRKIGLAPAHEVLVAVVRKTFFQKGAGRKEEALLRGLGRVAAQSQIDKIVNLLLREGALNRFRGDEGWVYTPNRPMAGRMKKMLYELRVSHDPIWEEVGKF